MDKRFWSIIVIIVIIFGGFIFLSSHNKKGTTNASNTPPSSNLTGKIGSSVKLQEYGDFECPACESFFLTAQAVQQKYTSTVQFQFSNLPLTSIHPNAFAGARAAQAAALQGKFWGMHDALYDQANWSEWSTSSNPLPYFWSYAQTLGLNVAKFKVDFASGGVNNTINADIAAFAKTGQPQSTPSFFLNGKPINNNLLLDASGQPSVDAFSKLIDAALTKQ